MQAFAGGVVCMTLCHALRVWLQQSADECFGHDTYDWASEIQAGLDCILRNVFVLLDAAKGAFLKCTQCGALLEKGDCAIVVVSWIFQA